MIISLQLHVFNYLLMEIADLEFSIGDIHIVYKFYYTIVVMSRQQLSTCSPRYLILPKAL